jgi:hypothetical protein
VRNELLQREKDIQTAINSGSTDTNLSTELSDIYIQLQNIEAEKAPARASIVIIKKKKVDYFDNIFSFIRFLMGSASTQPCKEDLQKPSQVAGG